MSYNKILQYRQSLNKFVKEQKIKIILIEEITDLDYIIGILFLTEMNRICKLNKLNVHGYYVAHSLINIFHKLRLQKSLNSKDILHFMSSMSENITYCNTRISDTNIKSNINTNLNKIYTEILPILNNLSEIENCNDKIKLWSEFFYMLFLISEFMSSGNYFNPNLKRLGEYYANIFYTVILSNQIDKNVDEIYENYVNYCDKLKYLFVEFQLNSETIEEIIKYIDDIVVKNLS